MWFKENLTTKSKQKFLYTVTTKGDHLFYKFLTKKNAEISFCVN